MNNTSLQYAGRVTFETLTRKYNRKNSGTRHLFRLFSSILAKENFNSLSLPTYLMLYDLSSLSTDAAEQFLLDGYDDPSYRVFKSFVDLNTYTVTENDEFSTEFTAVITHPMVLDLEETQIHNLELAIVAGDQQSILAHVHFDHDVFTIIQSGGQTTVRWNMSLDNAQEESIFLNV